MEHACSRAHIRERDHKQVKKDAEEAKGAANFVVEDFVL